MGFFKYILIIIIFFLLHSEIFSKENQAANDDFDFAESLFNEGDYYRAIGFYKRYIFFTKTKDSSKANYKIGLCYQAAKQINPAMEYFSKVINDDPGSRLSVKSRFQIGYTKYISRLYMFALTDFQKFTEDYPEDDFADDAQYLLGLASIFSLDWNKAQADFKNLTVKYPDSEFAGKSSELISECEKGKKLPKKYPWLAAIFSAVVPGSGQIYCDRYVDGITAFIINGALLTLTIVFANDENLSKGYAYTSGGLFGIFYISNIYGAINCAQNGNNIIKSNYINQLLEKYQYKPEKNISVKFSKLF